MPKKPEAMADVPAPVPDALGEPFFIPSLGITVIAPSLDEALAVAKKLQAQ